MARIAVWIITYRRPALLRRALASVLAQTYRDLLVRVVNDDPDDPEPGRIVAELDDARVALFEPVAHRGGAANFNLAFAETEAPFVSILEDDNWWEPAFLETMLAALTDRPDCAVAIGNERLWRERPDGGWQDTGQTIWPFSDTREHRYSAADICGSARLVNSAMLVRLAGAGDLRTPDDIPVDVTEHYRERLLGPNLVMVGQPFVNYAETLTTHRSTAGPTWGAHQVVLIGSVFAATASQRVRRRLAEALWRGCPSPVSPRAVSLVSAGLAVREARALLTASPPAALARFALWCARRPARILAVSSARHGLASAFSFLANAPLTRTLAAELEG